MEKNLERVEKRWNKHSARFFSFPYVLGHVRRFHWYFHFILIIRMNVINKDEKEKSLELVHRRHIQSAVSLLVLFPGAVQLNALRTQ